MKFGAILVASVAACAAAESVVVLTADSFESTLEGKNGLVKYYAPWCGHCKRLKPAFDQLGSEYEGHDSVVIAEADCTAEGKSLCQQKGVRGYPTLKYYVNGEENDYRSG